MKIQISKETCCNSDNNIIVVEPQVKDKYNIVLLFFFLMGLVNYIPWSFFTTSTEYWMYKFRNVSSLDQSNAENRTDLQALFTASTNSVLQVTSVVFLALAMVFGHLIQIKHRILGILSIVLALFFILGIFTMVNTDSYQNLFFGLTMITVGAVNALNSLFLITMYTLMAKFPQKYLAAFLSTSPLSRTVTSALEIISHFLGLGTTHSALVYFSIGVFIIFLSLLIAGFTLNCNQFYLECTQTCECENRQNCRISWPTAKMVFGKLWANLVAVAFATLVANALPLSLVSSEFEGQGQWPDVFFIPTVSFFTVAVFEWIGRQSTVSLPTINFNKYVFILISFINCLVFFPLVIFSNAQPRPHHLPIVFKHDYQYIIIVIFHSFFRGYILNCCSLNISKLISKDELKQAYHIYIVFCGLILALAAPVNILLVKIL